jgi:hypothetical protein
MRVGRPVERQKRKFACSNGLSDLKVKGKDVRKTVPIPPPVMVAVSGTLHRGE